MKNKKGFTLVELIVVIAIMAVLAAVLIPTVAGKLNEATDTANMDDAKVIADSIARYSIDHQNMYWNDNGCKATEDGEQITWATITNQPITGNTYNGITIDYTKSETEENVSVNFVTKSDTLLSAHGAEKGATVHVIVDFYGKGTASTKILVENPED